jgi:hypothetical protein
VYPGWVWSAIDTAADFAEFIEDSEDMLDKSPLEQAEDDNEKLEAQNRLEEWEEIKINWAKRTFVKGHRLVRLGT